jgi:hypothetical protein
MKNITGTTNLPRKNVRLKSFALLGIVLRMSYGKEQTFNLIPRF